MRLRRLWRKSNSPQSQCLQCEVASSLGVNSIIPCIQTIIALTRTPAHNKFSIFSNPPSHLSDINKSHTSHSTSQITPLRAGNQYRLRSFYQASLFLVLAPMPLLPLEDIIEVLYR